MIEFKYDGANRITDKIAGETNYKYTYKLGRLDKVNQGSDFFRSFTYHKNDLVKDITVKIPGLEAKTTGYTYDALNRVRTVTLPDDEVLTYTYDPAGNIETLSGTNGYLQSTKYHPWGSISALEYGNNTTIDFEYYNQSKGSYRLKSKNVQGPGNIDLNLTYKYDSIGNIEEIIDPHLGNQNFSYDDFNRLLSAKGEKAYEEERNFTYDKFNNLDKINYNSGEEIDFVYNAGIPSRIAHDGVWKYEGPGESSNEDGHDENGNIVMRQKGDSGSQEYGYHLFNRLQSVKTVEGSATKIEEYVYDDGDTRIKKTTGNVSTYYINDYYQEVHTTDNEGNEDIVKIKQYDSYATREGDDLIFIYTDHLGSTVRYFDQSVGEQFGIAYEPFGIDKGDIEMPLPPNGEPVFTGSRIQYRYAGQEKDRNEQLIDENRIYYYGARYYDPNLRRFFKSG